jgi:hypothetical protein
VDAPRDDSALAGWTHDAAGSEWPLSLLEDNELCIFKAHEAISNRFAGQPECSHELVYRHLILVTDERQNHEVSDFDVMLLDHTCQRIIGLAVPFERFFAN